jgi:hypothetical protein
VFEFGAFFLNQVRFAGFKIGYTNKLERSHVSDTYCMYMLYFDSIFMNFSRILGLEDTVTDTLRSESSHVKEQCAL